MDSETRVARLEAAVTTLAVLVFGAQDGHPFYGNQWTDAHAAVETTLIEGGYDRDRPLSDKTVERLAREHETTPVRRVQ